MIASVLSGGTPGGGIVTDGLIFRLNGLNMGDLPNGWVDEIKGVTLTGSARKQENGFRFQHDSLSQRTKDYFETENSTFQMCVSHISRDGNPRVFAQGAVTSISTWNVGYFRSKVVTGSKNGPHMPAVETTGTRNGTFSFSRETAYQNFKKMEVRGLDFWSEFGSDHITLGRKSAQYDGDSMDGVIHEIRIYNRILTEEEILQNQRHDIDAYFGGVTP